MANNPLVRPPEPRPSSMEGVSAFEQCQNAIKLKKRSAAQQAAIPQTADPVVTAIGGEEMVRAAEAPTSAPTAQVASSSQSRSRPLVRIKRVSGGRTKLLGLRRELLSESTQSEIQRVIELLKTPKEARASYFNKRRKFLQARTKLVAIKSKKIYPNTTSCAKRVFKIDEENPKANQVAKGLISAFTPELLAELTDEDPVLGKLKRARQKDDFKAFKKVDANLAQFYPISSISHEGILLVDNRIAIPSSLRKAILNHLHRGHPGQEKMVDAASYVWWPKLHRSIIDKAEKCPECTAYGKNIKTLKPRSKWDKIPDPTEPNEELQIDFAGPFNSTSRSKFHILVAVDRYSRFPSALITKSTGANKILKFLTGYMALHGVPKNIRTDQFSSFKSTEYKQFCKTNNTERK